MAEINYNDFYILYKGHPYFEPNQIVEDDVVKVIIQKYEMIIFTNKGEVLGEPNLGADLELLLFETKVSADVVEENIIDQINLYIPEIINTNYTLDVEFAQDPENYQDIMFVYFSIADYEVFAQIGTNIT